VYLAERVDGEFSQRVAVKIIDMPLRSAEVLQRFRAERQILATFAHPNIVSLIDAGVTADGQAYLVMEFVGTFLLTRESHSFATSAMPSSTPISTASCIAI
jgi:serine/threonine protein kinase